MLRPLLLAAFLLWTQAAHALDKVAGQSHFKAGPKSW